MEYGYGGVDVGTELLLGVEGNELGFGLEWGIKERSMEKSEEGEEWRSKELYILNP